MKRYLVHTAAFLSIVMLLSGCGGAAQSKDGMQGGMQGGRGGMRSGGAMQATAVKTQTIALSEITDEYMYSGSISPSEEVNVTSTLSGKVSAVYFDVGDSVRAGDVLFAMDTEDIEKNIRSSQASVNSAQTSVNTAQNNLSMANGASMQTQIENGKNSVKNAENSLKNAQTTVDNAQITLDNAKITLENSKIALDNSRINLEKAEKNYNDNSSLFAAGVISKTEMDNYTDAYEQAKNAYSQAELSLTQAQNQYNSAENQVKTADTQYQSAQDSLEQAQNNYDILVNETSKENKTKAEDSLKQAQAQLASSKVQLENTKKNLDDAKVKSPISGVVSQKNVTAGANLSQGTVPFVIISVDSVDVKVNVAEHIVTSINAGDAVRIKVPTLSEEYIEGNISYISPDANSDGTYEVKVNIPNSSGELKGGMFTEVYFTKQKSENAVVIDRDSVITKEGESYVFVADGDTAKKTIVEIGIDNGDMVEITSGLSEGMKIVTEGQTYLTDGGAINDVTNKKTESKTADENSDVSADKKAEFDGKDGADRVQGEGRPQNADRTQGEGRPQNTGSR